MDQSVLPRRRPVGITILAVLYLLAGVISLLWLLYLMVFLVILKAHLYTPFNVTETFVIIEGLVSLIIGIGLWQTQQWAFWASIAREIVFIAGSILLPLLFSNSSYQHTQILYSIIVLAYLSLSKDVHKAFFSATPRNT